MIFINRGRIARPKKLDDATEPALEELRKFHAEDTAYKRQRDAPFPNVHEPIVREPLFRLFHGKCAYCERPLEKQEEMSIDQFRPKSEAMNLDGSVSKDHYWWLAYEWENLYPACLQCKRAKGTRFPVRRRRAAPERKGNELLAEQPFLLDPCRSSDLPEETLIFNAEGMVHGATQRGEVTIDIFNLNRSELIAERKRFASQISEYINALIEVGAVPIAARSAEEQLRAKELFRELRSRLEDSQPFAGMHRQMIQPVLKEPVILEQVERIDQDGRIIEGDDYTSIGEVVVPKRTWSVPRAGAVWIDRVEIENFKAIEGVELGFPYETSADQEPWILLLGENGVGKSSILKAIALVFMEPRERKRFIPNAGSCVYNKAKPARGAIRVYFNTDEMAELTFAADNTDFTLHGDLPPYSLLAYGATRLPPGKESTAITEPRRVRVGNLFDPREALGHAERWLTDTSRVDPETFGLLAGAIRRLLDIEDEHQITRYRGNLRIQLDDKPVGLQDQSDGYQSVVALATDIMLNLASDWKTMQSAEGTVLLDEIEAHLHPKWKIEIVSRLRDVFPRIRFVATTHDPLCLQGTQSGEVYRLFRDIKTRRINALAMDVPMGLRADQLLTGSWFGLSSTLDENTLGKLNRHGELVAAGRLNASEKAELDELKITLRERLGGYGETSLERLAIGVAAQIMIEERDKIPQMKPQEIRQRVLEGVRKARQG